MGETTPASAERGADAPGRGAGAALPGATAPEPRIDVPGEWLFRSGGRVYGPIGGAELLGMLTRGEVDRSTPVAVDGGGWLPLADAPGLALHVRRFEARVRVEAEARRAALRARVRRGGRMLAAAAALVALVGGGVWLARTRPWEPRSRLLDALGTVTLGEVRVGARPARGADEVAVALPPDPAAPARPHAQAPRPEPRDGREPAAHASQAPAARASRLARGEAEGGELVTSHYDPVRIKEVVAREQGGLAECVRDEARRSPEFSGEIPIEFAVGNDGRVAALWIVEPRFKSGPLRECLLRKLNAWTFDPFPGERPVVSLAFRLAPR